MLTHFPVVALVDEYEKSLSVMEVSMPDYFRGARDSYREAIKGEDFYTFYSQWMAKRLLLQERPEELIFIGSHTVCLTFL